jgi:RHS repeat-associated protein
MFIAAATPQDSLPLWWKTDSLRFVILLAEHDEPSLAAKKKRQQVSSKRATSTPKNRVWGFENKAPGRISSEPDLSAETATGSVQFSYETASGRGYYYTRDHLGSVREMCSSTGTITSRMAYDPYGRTTIVSGTILPTKQYAGMYMHQPSGLYLTKGGTERPYDSGTGRWLSRDPSSEGGGINLYGYVGDDPVKLTDPFGLCANGEFKPLGLAMYQKSDDGNRPDEKDIIKRARKVITDAGEDVLPEAALVLKFSDQVTAAGQETFGDGQIFDVYLVLAYQCCCNGKWQTQAPDTMQVTWTDPDGERPLSEGGENSYMSHTQAATGGEGLKRDVQATMKTLFDNAKKHCSDKYGSPQN